MTHSMSPSPSSNCQRVAESSRLINIAVKMKGGDDRGLRSSAQVRALKKRRLPAMNVKLTA